MTRSQVEHLVGKPFKWTQRDGERAVGEYLGPFAIQQSDVSMELGKVTVSYLPEGDYAAEFVTGDQLERQGKTILSSGDPTKLVAQILGRPQPWDTPSEMIYKDPRSGKSFIVETRADKVTDFRLGAETDGSL
jgi:hypothetical protein